MCGIVGVFTPALDFPELYLTQMRDRLLHRGPDGGGNWLKRYCQGTVALGHRRLAILDPRSLANQPMISADGRKVIVFNGEIYNYIELRQELETLGRFFRTSGDTEVLLQAYEQWGTEALLRLNGMFAFILWDEDQHSALIARDRFGEKPLFFTRPGCGGIAFGSEIKALVAWPEVHCAIDVEQLERVQNGVIIHGRSPTLFAGIHRFLPAHLMWVTLDGSIKTYHRYWTPDYENIDQELSTQEMIAQFRALLSQSVRLRTRADVPVAACLSGGLDSSTLVGLLTQLQQPAFDLGCTISARFPDDPTLDEGTYMDQVLAYTQVAGQSVIPTAEGLVQAARRLHWHHEENILSTSMYVEWCVMRHARELGYPVMIDGQGADELLGGYQYYFSYFQHDQLWQGRWQTAFWNTLLYAWRLRRAAVGYQRSERRINPIPGLPLPQLLRRGPRSLADPTKYPDAPGLPPLRLGNSFRYTLASGMLYDSLPSQLHSGDRNAMAHGVESRFPFLDYDLVDWCLRLPDRALIKGGWQKAVLRKAADSLIPDPVRWRVDKIGFAAPQDEWLRGGLKTWIQERIFDPILADVASYDRDRLQQWWQVHQSRRADCSTLLWQWASLAEWLEMHRAGIWRHGL